MFSAFRLNPNPVRAAIQVGCDGLVTGSLARVALRSRAPSAIRDGMMHIELPLANSTQLQRYTSLSSSYLLDEATIAEATNALRKISSAVLRQQNASEGALLLMPPFDRAENTRIISEIWRKELRAQTFLFSDIDFVYDLNTRATAACDAQSSAPSSSSSSSAEPVRDRSSSSRPPNLDDNMEACWFLAHAAAAKNIAPHRLIIVSETPQRDEIELVGCDAPAPAPAAAAAAAGSPSSTLNLLRWTVPITSADCHRLLYEEVQRRPMAVYKGAGHSVNPLHRSEVAHLSSLIAQRFRPLIGEGDDDNDEGRDATTVVPRWVTERMEAGGVVCGSSPNGFALNTSARVAGSVNVSVEKLEQTTEFHYAGLSDALLSNFPLPSLIVPQCCLIAELCRAMRCRRIEYLPEVGVSHAMLVHPGLWTQHSLAEMTEMEHSMLEDHKFAQQKSFSYPHQAVDRFDPNRVR